VRGVKVMGACSLCLSLDSIKPPFVLVECRGTARKKYCWTYRKSSTLCIPSMMFLVSLLPFNQHNAPSFILVHQVTLFEYSDAFRHSSTPSSGNAISTVNFSIRHMASSISPTTWCTSRDVTPWRWHRRAPKCVGVILKQLDLASL
jgi:hypothetical protein